MRQTAEELRAVLRQLGGIEATIAAGGPQARPGQESVASAKRRIGDTARALDAMHVDIRKRAALLEEHEQPNGVGGLLDLLERDAEGLLDGGRDLWDQLTRKGQELESQGAEIAQIASVYAPGLILLKLRRTLNINGRMMRSIDQKAAIAAAGRPAARTGDRRNTRSGRRRWHAARAARSAGRPADGAVRRRHPDQRRRAQRTAPHRRPTRGSTTRPTSPLARIWQGWEWRRSTGAARAA